MTFQPYSPPVELARAPCVRLTSRKAMLHRMLWSLGCSALSCVSIVAMVCLVEWHEPGDPMLAADYFPFGKVVIPLAIAGMAACLASLFSVPVFLSGRNMPAIWLLPLVLFILWFFKFYDWAGLFDSGKPRYDLLVYGMEITWALLRYGPGGMMLLYVVEMTIVIRWGHWQERRIAARDAAVIDQIVADEIASRSALKH